MRGSDRRVAHHTRWRNTGQKGRGPGWNAWLPAEGVVSGHNVLNPAIPIFGDLGEENTIRRNAYLSAPLPPSLLV
jgi:hypothetical protein